MTDVERALAIAALDRALAELQHLRGRLSGEPGDCDVDPVAAKLIELRERCSEERITVTNGYVGTYGAATLLGRRAHTLENWRARGVGPSWRKLPGSNRVDYSLAALAHFLIEGETDLHDW